MKIQRFNKFLLSITSLIIFVSCADSSKKLYGVHGNTMGTTYSVKIVKDANQQNPPVNYETLSTKIDSLLLAVNRQMSTYMQDSEISRFNQFQDTTWFPISEDFAKVLLASYQICEASNGAFDFTVGPLVNLWGFGPENREEMMPTEQEINERKAKVGYRKINIRLNPPAVKKAMPDMYCDLSATAKGFGVDKVAGYFDSLNISNYLVEIGGEVRAKGVNEREKTWVIGIQTPDESNGIRKIVHLKDYAMATSGDYFNYYEIEGKRYSHTIDPRTGKPVTHKLASVSVMQKSCMIADGLATAIDVLGPEKGYQFALTQKLPVFMIVRGADGFEERMTPEFKAVLEIRDKE